MKVAIWVALVVALLAAILLAGCSGDVDRSPQNLAATHTPRIMASDGKPPQIVQYGYEPEGDVCVLYRWLESSIAIMTDVPCTERVLRLAGQQPRDARQSGLAKLTERERAALGIVP